MVFCLSIGRFCNSRGWGGRTRGVLTNPGVTVKKKMTLLDTQVYILADSCCCAAHAFGPSFWTLTFECLFIQGSSIPWIFSFFIDHQNKIIFVNGKNKVLIKGCLYKAVHWVLTCQWLNIPKLFYSNMSKLFWSNHSVVKTQPSGMLYVVSDLYIWLLVDNLWVKFTSSNKLWSRMCVKLLHFPFTSTRDHEEPLWQSWEALGLS